MPPDRGAGAPRCSIPSGSPSTCATPPPTRCVCVHGPAAMPGEPDARESAARRARALAAADGPARGRARPRSHPGRGREPRDHPRGVGGRGGAAARRRAPARAAVAVREAATTRTYSLRGRRVPGRDGAPARRDAQLRAPGRAAGRDPPARVAPSPVELRAPRHQEPGVGPLARGRERSPPSRQPRVPARRDGRGRAHRDEPARADEPGRRRGAAPRCVPSLAGCPT